MNITTASLTMIDLLTAVLNLITGVSAFVAVYAIRRHRRPREDTDEEP